MLARATQSRTAVVLAAAALFASLGACASTGSKADSSKALPPIEMPAHAAPAKELEPLKFLAGRWICVTPNKLINEEHWSEPRGNFIVALFRQIRRDGKPALIEVTQLSAEPESKDEGAKTIVVLRLRHLHANLEIPEKRRQMTVFHMKEAGENRARFVETGAAPEKTTSVTYSLVGSDELKMEVSYPEGAGEKGYSLLYRREGK